MRVGVVGVGGLGSPALWKLGALEPSLLRFWDPDRLELGNLHRQIIYSEADVGRPKARLAEAWFSSRFPKVELEARAEVFDEKSEVQDLDLLLDCSDGFDTKLTVNQTCVEAGLPFVFAACSSWSAQVMGVRPGESACVVCVFGQTLRPEAFPTCAEVGAFGPLLGRVAALQVDVGVELLRGGGTGELQLLDRGELMEVVTERRSECPCCGLRPERMGGEGQEPALPQAEQVDLRGLRCPATFVETRRRLERMPVGSRLWIVFDSDESARTVPRSALAAGHRVVATRSQGGVHRVLLERGT